MSEIKEKTFICLPDIVTSEGSILSWGRVINNYDGGYDHEILAMLEGITEGMPSYAILPERIDVGALNLFSPGTKFTFDKTIKTFVHEYARRREFHINDPTSLQVTTLKKSFDFKNVQDTSNEQALANLPVFLIPDYQGFDFLVIPCNVVADYYFYGMPKMIDNILQRKFSRDIRQQNLIYDPSNLDLETLPNGKVIAYIRLRKDMYSIDAVKIARLAYDKYFWNCAMEMAGGLVADTSATYLTTKFPIRESTTISFYCYDMILGDKKLCFALSIALCTAKLPFDGLIVSRDNPGAGIKGTLDFNDGKSESQETEKPTTGDVTKTLFIGSNKPPGPDKVGSANSRYNSLDVNMTFPRDQKDNFDNSCIITEEVIVEGGRSNKLKNFLLQFDALDLLSTSRKKTGRGKIVRLILSGKGAISPNETSQVKCFELTEEAIGILTKELTINSICPYKDGKDIYSTFPIDEFQKTRTCSRKNLNFCFINVRQNGRTIRRRVLIKEIQDGQRFLYIIDIQPNETAKADSENITLSMRKWSSIFCNKDFSKIIDFKMILVKCVEERAIWKKVLPESKFKYKKVKHTTAENMAKRFILFILEDSWA